MMTDSNLVSLFIGVLVARKKEGNLGKKWLM